MPKKPRKTFKIGDKLFRIGDKVEILAWDTYKYVRKNGIITYVIPPNKKPTKRELMELYGDHIPEEIYETLAKAIKRTRIRIENPYNTEGYYVVPVIDEKLINLIDKIEPDVNNNIKIEITKDNEPIDLLDEENETEEEIKES